MSALTVRQSLLLQPKIASLVFWPEGRRPKKDV